MAFYQGAIDALGFADACAANGGKKAVFSMDSLAAKAQGTQVVEETFPFPSLDELHRACPSVPQSRDVTTAVADGFLAVKDVLKFVLDPLTQPLSWMLNGALTLFTGMPWFVLIPILAIAVWAASRSKGVTAFVVASMLFFAFIDHLEPAVQTLSIIFVCTLICIVLGVPLGVAMSKFDRFRAGVIPILDLLQTLPSFVYLIPLIFLFSVTEPKLYGIAIILYAIVPVVRLTDLGIRLVDRDVLEAADAFGMSARQKLLGVEMPLALPNIMAGVNQTIMMSLAMVVIASLVSAPGLGVLVLRGIRNLELGVGLIAGLGIVILAVILDRTSKAALDRIDVSRSRL